MSRVGAAGAATGASVPVVWDFLGYHFEAGPLIVAICATLMTRLIVSLNTPTRPKVLLDVAVTMLSVLVSALWVQANALALLPAGLSGIGFGTMGITIITLAKGPAGTALKAAFRAFLGSMNTPPK
ncbi:hypothetical protein [uncultured Sphingomonas sp.]|uniref:hypothetical protein n=1 Tax=uncultured Sphingomonas sp. TaxID=158754 RepID=UPI0025D905A4|nr:hypothetical protein [uncultured Sphingomonas sp.]